jgi:pyrimidine operon attenuation protein/uracil phosphoribosyltransferase
MKLDLEHSLASMKTQLTAYCEKKNIENAIVVGIHTGGVWVAERLISAVPTTEPLATLDITFYRDDFTKAGLNPKVNQTSLPAIDDVLMSGRTIRAAMNEIFDFGRPASITLAILYDLGQHELPIAADIVGEHLTLNPDQRVKLTGPKTLGVSIIDTH